MTPNMNNDVGFENVSEIFIKREVLMMRRHDVRTMEAICVRLPSALRLWTDKDIAHQQTWNDEIASVGQHGVSGRFTPAGQSFQIQCLELQLEISEVIRFAVDSIERALPDFLHERTRTNSEIFRIVIDEGSSFLQLAV